MYSAQHNKTSANFIFRLPAEVLLNVFAFIDPSDRVYYRYVSTAQILILRWVCRLFRRLSCALPYWTESQKLLWDIRGGTGGPRRRFATLLMDQHLAIRLSERSHWEFWDNDLFTTVSSLVPDFHTTARNLKFFAFHGYDHLIRSIAPCRALTSLSLDSRYVGDNSLDLSLIPRYLPFLSELSIANFDIYYGSLQECSSLRHLCLRLMYLTNGWLPLGSSETLISLSLCHWKFSPLANSDGVFDGFSNLRSLRIEESLDSSLYCIVAHSSLALHELDVDIPGDTNLRPFFEMFDSPALSHLESLRITEHAPWLQFYPSSFYWKRQSKLLQIITRALQHLQALELEMRINRHWIPLLAGLSSLKRLKWTIRKAQARNEEYCANSERRPAFEDYLESQGDETGDDAADLPVGELETMFRDVWRSSLNPPHIDITPPPRIYLTEAEDAYCHLL
jgi:hypothetical protein